MSVIATSDDSTKRLPPLMQVTVIDPREKFSTSPRELAIDPVAPLFPGQKKSQSIHESSNRIKQRYKKLSSLNTDDQVQNLVRYSPRFVSDSR